MKIYMAVTADRYELPLCVSESAQTVADWAGVAVKSVHIGCSRSRNQAPFDPICPHRPYRFRKIIITEDEK